MGYEGEKAGIPRVVKDCIQYLQESGIYDFMTGRSILI